MTNFGTVSETNPMPIAYTHPWSKAFWAVFVLAAVLGAVGVAQRLMYGHLLAGYGSYVPWGLWIGLYFLGIGISGGSFVIGAVGYMLGVPGFSKRSELRVAIVLSISAIIPAFAGVALDLGHMERLPTIISSPIFTSMMAFNAWMYNLFLVVAAISWLLTFKEDIVWMKPMLVLGTFFSILFPSQSGVFFEAVRTNEFWHSPILSVLFLASAVALGASALLLVRSLLPTAAESIGDQDSYGNAVYRLRLVAMIGVIVYLTFEFAELSIAVWSPGAHSPNVQFLLFGPYRWVFWIAHLLVGALIPLALLGTGRRRLWALAAFLVVVGFAAARMCVLVPGQITGRIPYLQEAFQDSRLTYSYHPTTMEYLVAFFMLAVGMIVFYVGMRLNEKFAANSASQA